MFARILPLIVASVALLAITQTAAEACCGPNQAPSFFRHQYHAFKRGHVPGYLHPRYGRRR